MSYQTITSFDQKREDAKKILNQLLQFLEKGESLNVEIDRTYIDKIKEMLANLESDKLKVALIGGFSEGKTSIAAAWIGKLDKSTMKISQQESSDEVAIYDVEDKLVLIDTPGLFGFKEKNNSSSLEAEKYKDITKKYVSQADIVLYVVNSTNPIKESHSEELHWLFRDLNLLPRTVFVLSRFDEVADVEDEDDYQEVLEIKKYNIMDRLTQMLHLTLQERDNLSIVAVSANPFDEGVDYWFEHMDEFKKLSHIQLLQDATKEIIERNGGPMAIVQETQKSVIADVLYKQLPIAKERNEQLNFELQKNSQMISALTENLNILKKQFILSQSSLRDFISTYFSDLINQAEGTSLETIGHFFNENIGSNGCIIDARVTTEFQNEFNAVNQIMSSTITEFDNEVKFVSTIMQKFGAKGLKQVVKGNFINNNTILATRDGLNTVTKMVGLDFSKYLKFKPWGATKFARGANGFLSILAIGLELHAMYKDSQREKEFIDARESIVDNLRNQQKMLLDKINAPNLREEYFPQISELGENLSILKNNIEKQTKISRDLQEWEDRGKELAVQLTNL